jgi:hypothetical protein
MRVKAQPQLADGAPWDRKRIGILAPTCPPWLCQRLLTRKPRAGPPCGEERRPTEQTAPRGSPGSFFTPSSATSLNQSGIPVGFIPGLRSLFEVRHRRSGRPFESPNQRKPS